MTTYYASDPTEVRVSVSAVVRRRDEPSQILLMQRSDNQHWGLPGGYVEPGESVQQRRAARSARGDRLRDRGRRLIGVYSDPSMQVVDYGDARRVHAINLCFEAIAGVQRELGTPDETLAFGFFGIDALPTPFVPIHAIRVSDAAHGGPRDPGAVRGKGGTPWRAGRPNSSSSRAACCRRSAKGSRRRRSARCSRRAGSRSRSSSSTRT
jgi:ADP-ribose pyrophosphatase YjhB (NUDIX family)